VDKEKQAAPAVQLNVIRLLADLNVSVKKPEMVDMILPLFIESLEEGDASTPSLLRLRVWNFVFIDVSTDFVVTLLFFYLLPSNEPFKCYSSLKILLLTFPFKI